MTTEQQVIDEIVGEYVKECRHVLEYAEEVRQHIASGNKEAAIQIASLGGGKLGQANDVRVALLKRLGS